MGLLRACSASDRHRVTSPPTTRMPHGDSHSSRDVCNPRNQPPRPLKRAMPTPPAWLPPAVAQEPHSSALTVTAQYNAPEQATHPCTSYRVAHTLQKLWRDCAHNPRAQLTCDKDGNNVAGREGQPHPSRWISHQTHLSKRPRKFAAASHGPGEALQLASSLPSGYGSIAVGDWRTRRRTTPARKSVGWIGRCSKFKIAPELVC